MSCSMGPSVLLSTDPVASGRSAPLAKPTLRERGRGGRLAGCRSTPRRAGAPCSPCCGPTLVVGPSSARSSRSARRWRSPARSSCARSSTRRRTGASTAEFVAPGPGVPRHRRRHPGHRRRRHPVRHRHGVGHDERAAPAHHPPRARPRPRVPPPPHARRADPARRRRRHVGVRLPRPGRAQGRRRRPADRRDARSC